MSDRPSTSPEPYEVFWRQLLCQVMGGPFAHISDRTSFILWIILWLSVFIITHISFRIYIRIRKATFYEKSMALCYRLYELGIVMIAACAIVSAVIVVFDGYALLASLLCGRDDHHMISFYLFTIWCIATVLLVSFSTGMTVDLWTSRKILKLISARNTQSIPVTTEESGAEPGVSGYSNRAGDRVSSDQPPQYEAQATTEQESKEGYSRNDETIAINEIRPAESAHVRPAPRGSVP